MPIGNPVTLTSNVASKAISVTATASQTLFNVTGGYRINELGVFKNGLRLQDGVDYTARDGLTVTLLSAASGGDKLQFVVFDTFRVAEAIRPAVDEQTIRGNLNVVGILSCTNLEGPVSLNITSGIQTFHDVRVGGALTVAGTLTYEDTSNSNVTGIATFSDQVSIGDSIFHTGDSDTSIRFPAADTFTVETGGSERVRVNSSGFVGVNTDNPGRQLEIFGTAATVLQLNSTNSGGTSLRIQNSGTDKMYMGLAGDFITGQGSNVTDSAIRGSGALLFASGGGTERLRVTSDGDVGIGTTIPSKLLELAQSNSTAYSATDFDQDYQVLKLRNYTNDKSVGMQFLIGNNGEAAITAHEEDADGETTLAFGVRGSGSRAERLHITSAGSVGINTDDPDSMLTIAGTSGDNARLEIKRTASSTGGYVGAVNFTALDGHSVASVSARSDGDNEGAHLIIRTTSAAAENSPFGANTFERLRVTSAGLVGIATAVPEAQLTVKGDNDLDAPPNKYLYSDGHGIQIRGGESALDIVSSDDGSHASSVLLRSSSDGFAAVFNPTLNQLEIKYFVPSANDFTVHAAGNFVSTLNTALRIGSTGICTATQFFEGTTRVATTGKAIAMAMLFG